MNNPISLNDTYTLKSAGISTTFTSICATCGAIIRIVNTIEQPHRCRIEIS